MKFIVIILWLQLALGLAGAYIAFASVHTAAMGIEWGRGMHREFERVRQSSEYREPPMVKGYSLGRFVEGMETAARRQGEIALLAFVSCLAASVFAAVLLGLFHRFGRKEHANNIS